MEAPLVQLRWLWFALLGKMAYRRLLLLERRLDERILDAPALVPVEIGLLQPTEIADYARLVPGTSVADVRSRLDAGQMVEGLDLNQRPLGYEPFAIRHPAQRATNNTS